MRYKKTQATEKKRIMAQESSTAPALEDPKIASSSIWASTVYSKLTQTKSKHREYHCMLSKLKKSASIFRLMERLFENRKRNSG